MSDRLKRLTLAFVVFFRGGLDQAQARLVIGGVLSVHQPQDPWTVADYGRLWQTEYVDTQYGSHLRAIRSAGQSKYLLKKNQSGDNHCPCAVFQHPESQRIT